VIQVNEQVILVFNKQTSTTRLQLEYYDYDLFTFVMVARTKHATQTYKTVRLINVLVYRRLMAYKSYKISYILKILHHLLYNYFQLCLCNYSQVFVQKWGKIRV